MRTMHNIQLDRITSLRLAMHSQLLLQLVPIQIIPPGSDIPTPEPLTVYPVEVDLADEGRPVVFCDVRPVGPLERLVLDFGS